MPDHLDMYVLARHPGVLRAGLPHLRDEPERRPGRQHRLLGLQRPRVELRGTAQPQRMPGHRQRHPQAGRPQRPQPPQGERQPDRARLPGQAPHAVHRVVLRDPLCGFIR